MEEEVLGLIDDELDLVDDIEYDETLFERINDKVDEQNDSISMENYRLELLRILRDAKEMNIDISYNDDMTIEELERIVSSIRL